MSKAGSSPATRRALALRALGWVPLLAALVALCKLCAELVHQAPVAVDLDARCRGACSIELPDRHGELSAVRLLLPSSAVASLRDVAPWQVCARGECHPAIPREAFGWTELPIGRALRGEPLRLVPPQPDATERSVRARLLYGFSGWRAVLSRARRTWDGIWPG